MRGTGRVSLIRGIIGMAVLVAGTAAVTLAASARSSPPAASPAAVGSYPGGTVAGPTGATRAGGPAPSAQRSVIADSSATAVPYAAWCCADGSPLGLTVTGQASAPGTGAAARAAAVARAAADATSQARAAASGAGVSLGRIINMEVSVPYYPYSVPMEGAARAGRQSGVPVTGVAGAGGSGGGAPAAPPAPACPAGAGCPGYPRASSIFASVTITWAIA